MQSLNQKPTIVKVNQIYFDIYYYLYLSTKSNSKNDQSKFSFIIPDTVLFLDDRPVAWIFTNKKGKLMKKYNSKLNNQYILEYFTKKCVEYGTDKVAGYYVYSSDDNKDIKFEDPKENERFLNQKKLVEYMNRKCIALDPEHEDLNKTNTLIHEFFTTDNLKHFLENQKKRQGFLQIFVNSQQDPNSTYRLIWSPSHLTAEIRCSRLYKAKQGVHFYEKIVTFESDEYCINTDSVRSQIAIDKLNNICLEIIDAMQYLFNHSIKVKTAVFYLKQDLNFNLNFLYCSSIGFIEYEDKEHQVFAYKGKIFRNKLSDNFPFHPHKVIYKKKETENYESIICVSCQKTSIKEKFHDIDYLSLIKFHEYNRSKPPFKQFDCKIDEIFKNLNILTVMKPKTNREIEKTSHNRINYELMRVDHSNIPIAIKNENPHFTPKDYMILKHNKLFLEKKTQVCEDCFFQLVDLKYFTEDDFNAKIFQGNIKKNIVRQLSLSYFFRSRSVDRRLL